MGNKSLLWIEVAFKSVQDLVRAVGGEAVPQAYVINLENNVLYGLKQTILIISPHNQGKHMFLSFLFAFLGPYTTTVHFTETQYL